MRDTIARAGIAVLAISLLGAPGAEADEGYSSQEILEAAENLFGQTTEGLAKVVEKVFAEHGRPNGYIAGEEVSGAIGVGLTFGKGQLTHERGEPVTVYWQGPSIGFDLGGDASKVFVLVYGLPAVDAIFQRFPGVDGSVYYVGGVGVNYQRSQGTVLAPIRVGVGLRARASVGYTHYTRERSWVPL